MATCVSSACFSALSERRVPRVRAVASENVTSEDDKVKLGGSNLKVTRLGIGAWSWGDTSYWNNFQWDDRKMKAAKAAFDVSVDGGITFFDTAEVYGSRMRKASYSSSIKFVSFGAVNYETLLGMLLSQPNSQLCRGRLGRQNVIAALKDSLSRLELSSVELYQLHWPGIWGNEDLTRLVSTAVKFVCDPGVKEIGKIDISTIFAYAARYRLSSKLFC
ncbi:oxidoreductase [Pyrus ussuriensis x Pyrus communis]|uniref:Oxidoreductase n=1 Tax=Pyrus ussuriensis x Pyrus communis TaxID=2448454 RepID=A0A5N5G684_9ROSA|nr:oxidoreductase [Pyrus ussuriensis x Pyrus communis]